MGGVHRGMAAGFYGVAVRQLRQAAALLRTAAAHEAAAWSVWRGAWTRAGRRRAYAHAAAVSVQAAAVRADAHRRAADAHVLGAAIGSASVVLAADAAMRRAEGRPVVLPVVPLGVRARLSRVEVVERAAVVAWLVVLVVAVVTR